MLYKTLVTSDHWFPRLVRHVRRSALNFSISPPRLLLISIVSIFLALRAVYYFVVRVFICEPFFKYYCTEYGRNFHTGVFLHWVQGRGALVVGDNVTIDGKCSFSFAGRYSEQPTLVIGDNSSIGHGCSLTVGDRITVGKHCRIGIGVGIFDAGGHPLSPELRLKGFPANREDVRPVAIEDNVWIGSRAIIMPGVTIGRNSIIAAGSVVMNSIPPNCVAGGNPARQLRALVE
ncbi:MAG: hypothetical protein C5B58_14645 [Acidobacteria bacterium]|nr:MAG: hypothetical protein C5B58_14645 [Acidobacteriota bacterium]